MAIATAVLTSENITAEPFVHPGMLNTREQLDLIKKRVQSGEQPWAAAWDSLRAGRGASTDFTPEPFAHVVRGPYGRPSIGDRQLSRSARAVYSHALQWAITEDKAHAEKAIEILNAWSGRLWTFQDNDAKLLAAWTGDEFCNAAEILRYTDSGWKEEDIEQFERMLRTVYYPLLEGFFPEANGNWDGAIINTMLCMAIFLDDRAMFDKAINHYIRGPVNGGITKYIFPSGQCQETTRDQAHTQLGLREFSIAARVAWNQGVDLYSVADNRLALGFEYTAKYMLGKEVHTYGGPASPQRRGRLSDIYESVYQHYHHVKGLEMPFVKRAVDRKRNNRRWWSALNVYDGPLANPPELTGPPLPSTRAPKAGAQDVPTATPPEAAVQVAAGEDIQSALNKVGAGGWVVLGKGIHAIDTTLMIPSGITLAGQGIETVLFLDPDGTDRAGVAISNGAEDLHDVTFRDFVVEGAVDTEFPNDPNSKRMVEASRGAKRRAGVVLAAQHDGQMKNIRFEHVTVRNCSRDGVSIFGVTNLEVISCDFTYNGGSVVPGPGLQHNLLLSGIVGGKVDGSRLDTSTWGCGLDLSRSQNVTITNSEIARNGLHGVRVTESTDVTIENSLIEGNDGSGIDLSFRMDGSQGVKVNGNTVRNNADAGIDVAEGVEAVLEDNLLVDNLR